MQAVSQGVTGQDTSIHGERYRYLGGTENVNEERARYLGGDAIPQARYTGVSVTLYGRGEALAVSRNSSSGTRNGAAYLGKDILGSVRSASNSGGSIDDRYEYDAFGKPYSGNFSTGMNLGYTGKPYDQATGMYNYGYRDYQPVQARFTTVDPIRDGANWMAYVNNDAVNFRDTDGLAPQNMSEADRAAYMAEIARYAAYNNATNKMGIPDKSASGTKMDCADVAAYLYGQAMQATGNTTSGNAISKLTGVNSTPARENHLDSDISSASFSPSNTNNITFYENKNFNNPNVEVGTVAVWSNHVATVVDVQRDTNGNVTRITTIEGHLNSPTSVDDTNRTQSEWDQYSARGETFYGFGEIGKDSTTKKGK